jgi:TRAP-type C4-dicarboxylate transport system permease small subunit
MSVEKIQFDADGPLGDPAAEAGFHPHYQTSIWMKPLEVTSAALMALIVFLLLVAVVTRYVLATPVIWIEEVIATSFVWLAMIGACIAMHRNEHLKLTLFLVMLPERTREIVHAFALVCVAAFLMAVAGPAYEYAVDEWVIRTPTLEIPSTFRVSAMLFGIVSMLIILINHAFKNNKTKDLIGSAIVVCILVTVFWYFKPQFQQLPIGLNISIFLALFVTIFLVSGVIDGFQRPPNDTMCHNE